ncbi:MAG: O-antigen ligase family protein [Candidatus Omnitrophica bacterium]|nr:O-antigen ligase family protein [Candidatus Omnitrophota bacterium]
MSASVHRSIGFLLGINLALSVAFFGATPPWAASGLAASCFVLGFIFVKDVVLAWNEFPLGIRFFVIVLGIYLLGQSVIFAADPQGALQGLMMWNAMGVTFLLATRSHSMAGFGHIVIFMALVETIYGLFSLKMDASHVLWRVKELHQGYLTGTYLNRNHFAGFLELALGFVLGELFSAWKKNRKREIALYWAFFLFLFYGLMRSGSRAGIVCFVMSFLLTGILFFRSRIPVRRGIAVFVALAIGFWAGAQTLQSRFQWDEGSIEPVSGRLWVWQETLPMIQSHFWTGIGLGNFYAVFPQFQSERLLLGWGHAHNDYLELLSELGGPAFLGFAMIVGWFVICHSKRGLLNPVVLGGIVGIVSFALHGFADFNFAIPANLYLFLISLGLFYGISRNPEGEVFAK